jgi:hypothetical protein
MFKSKGQTALVLVGLFSLVLGIMTMLRVPTVILPPWFLVLIYVPIIIGVSFLLGLVTKLLIKIDANNLAYTSIFITIFSLAFYISEYKPTIEIIVPENFNGVVKLFLSNEDKDDFHLNSYGVGYVCKATYYGGFKPKVVKDGQDITNRLSDFSEGSIGFGGVDGKNVGPYKYLSFKISPQATDTLSIDLMKMIELNILDTTRILKQN